MGTEVTFDRAGAVWRWQYKVEDRCGTSTISTRNLVMTDNGSESPCCPLGMSKDPTNQRSACVKPEYCICSPSKCQSLETGDTATNTDIDADIDTETDTDTDIDTNTDTDTNTNTDTDTGRGQHGSFVLTSFLMLFFCATMTA